MPIDKLFTPDPSEVFICKNMINSAIGSEAKVSFVPSNDNDGSSTIIANHYYQSVPDHLHTRNEGSGWDVEFYSSTVFTIATVVDVMLPSDT